MSLVTAFSFGYSLVETSTNPVGAYFVTPTRAWEFGAGGLLALAGARARPSPALSWIGLAAIAASAFAFSVKTPFPGWAAAVPVLGALAVIYAGAPGRVLALRPVQFLGDISYSVYLWHWPLIVLAPYVDSVTASTPTPGSESLCSPFSWLGCPSDWSKIPCERRRPSHGVAPGGRSGSRAWA